ncbi:sulfotransferase family protein [Telmatospirillum sp.]|uniref:sulfotransferase family protein n=1 Tax=Telmatospirillum sp. TaxID=2079197 RepID=UPI00284B4121|nr:sulfotransferase family protein [Telmatospirillum sp.]MDR3438449.1 sulfotransferase family protein [Telmatospirillum sp.]
MAEVAAGLNDLDALADLIREDSPTLESLVLAPDGKYQTRQLTMSAVHQEVVDDLAAAFRCRDAGDFPVLYCGWGKARVGSTALNNLFGLAGLPSYYQPIKALLRHRLSGSRAPLWHLPAAAAEPCLFSKEVAGPYVLAECLYIPLRMLVEAGYPVDKLHLVLLDRHPVDCLSSWYAKWSDRVPRERLLHHHVLASLNVIRVAAYARRQGIPVTHYVYEASRDAVTAAGALFRRLGLAQRFHEDAVTNWKGLGDLDSDDAKVIYPDEPAAYSVPGLHGADTAYRFHGRGDATLDADALDVLERCGVLETYWDSVRACVADLTLDQRTADRLLSADYRLFPTAFRGSDI